MPHPPTSPGPRPIHFLCVCAPLAQITLRFYAQHTPLYYLTPRLTAPLHYLTLRLSAPGTLRLSAPDTVPHSVPQISSHTTSPCVTVPVWPSALNSATLPLLLTQCHRHPFTHLSLWPSALNTCTYLSLWPSVNKRYNTLGASPCDLVP